MSREKIVTIELTSRKAPGPRHKYNLAFIRNRRGRARLMLICNGKPSQGHASIGFMKIGQERTLFRLSADGEIWIDG